MSKKIDIEKEIRRLVGPVEIRATKEGDIETKKIVGHAAVFNILTDNLRWFREKIQPGAFAKTIKVDDIRALVDHDSSRILGRNTAGTLTLREDDEGLLVSILPPDTQVGRDIVTNIENGNITGMSFGFQTITDAWHIEDKEEIRTLIEVKLFDVSPVTFPAYAETDVVVAKRSLEHWEKEHKSQNKSQSMSMRLALAEIEID